jgi:DNA-binding NarL/FixJ family response regulator
MTELMAAAIEDAPMVVTAADTRWLDSCPPDALIVLVPVRGEMMRRLMGEANPLDPLRDRLTRTEVRVLRYLPTNLTIPEIARELTVSVNTTRTHVRHVYEKLAAHSRYGAVERARSLGLIDPDFSRP